MSEAPQLSKTKVRKNKLVSKLRDAFSQYSKVMIVDIDHVGSKQMQQVRVAVRDTALVVMGKNTIMRMVLRELIPTRPELEAISEQLRGNRGLIFTDADLSEIREIVEANTVPAAARAGQFSQCDVLVQPGPTGLGPGQTAFFTAMNIQTKIVKGNIEICSRVQIVSEGERVTSSAAALLAKLDIRPFSYRMEVLYVFEDGCFYAASVLALTDEALLNKFFNAVNKVAAISLATGYPSQAAIPHLIANGFKNLVAIAVETDITFEEAKIYKDFVANPEAFAAANAAAAPAAEETAAAPAAESSESESDEDMGFSLFD